MANMATIPPQHISPTEVDLLRDARLFSSGPWRDVIHSGGVGSRDHDTAVATKWSLGRPPWYAPACTLGDLGVLPAEVLLVMIDSHLDLLSVFRLRKVNRCARQLVARSRPYRILVLHATECLRAVLRTGLGRETTLGDLFAQMRMPACALCGAFAGFLFLPTAMRVCFSCIRHSEDPRLGLATLSEVVRAYLRGQPGPGRDRDRDRQSGKRFDRLVPLKTVRGLYGPCNDGFGFAYEPGDPNDPMIHLPGSRASLARTGRKWQQESLRLIARPDVATHGRLSPAAMDQVFTLEKHSARLLSSGLPGPHMSNPPAGPIAVNIRGASLLRRYMACVALPYVECARKGSASHFAEPTLDALDACPELGVLVRDAYFCEACVHSIAHRGSHDPSQFVKVGASFRPRCWQAYVGARGYLEHARRCPFTLLRLRDLDPQDQSE